MVKCVRVFLAFWALACMGPRAWALSSFELPQGYLGNMLGLAYRETDGHFFVSQNAITLNPWWSASFIHELDASGALLRSVELTALLPDAAAVTSISVPESGGEVYLQIYGPEPDFPTSVVALSPDLSTVTGTLPVPAGLIGHVTDDLILSYRFDSPLVYFTSRATGDVRTVDVGRSGFQSIAPSWSGGFFAVDDFNLQSSLMEFDAQGHLLKTMVLDRDTFGYHPLAIDTDMAGQRIFVNMGNGRVFVFGAADFIDNVTPQVPEPTGMALALSGLAVAGVWAGHRRAVQNRK